MSIPLIRLSFVAYALLLTGCIRGGDIVASPEPISELDRIIAAHVEAVGGVEALQRRQSVELEIEISEPGFTLDGHYRAMRNGAMRIDVYSGETRVFTEAFDGETGWQLTQNAETPDPMSENGEAAVRRGIYGHLFGLHEFEALGIAVVTSGREVVDGINYYLIDLTYPDGHQVRQFINPQTYLIDLQRDEHAIHPDLNPEAERFERRYSQFNEADGVVYSDRMVMTNMDTGDVRQTVNVRYRRYNERFADAVFSGP